VRWLFRSSEIKKVIESIKEVYKLVIDFIIQQLALQPTNNTENNIQIGDQTAQFKINTDMVYLFLKHLQDEKTVCVLNKEQNQLIYIATLLPIDQQFMRNLGKQLHTEKEKLHSLVFFESKFIYFPKPGYRDFSTAFSHALKKNNAVKMTPKRDSIKRTNNNNINNNTQNDTKTTFQKGSPARVLHQPENLMTPPNFKQKVTNSGSNSHTKDNDSRLPKPLDLNKNIQNTPNSGQKAGISRPGTASLGVGHHHAAR
jgi:hypothetical protein